MKKKKPNAKPKTPKESGNWYVLKAAAYIVDGEKNTLAVMVMETPHVRSFGVMAVSSPGKSIDAVLEEHSHQNIGEFKNYTDAFIAAEAFAKEWLHTEKTEACKCDEISKLKSSSKRCKTVRKVSSTNRRA